MNKPSKCICGNTDFELLHEYTSRPEGEIAFSFSSGDYLRRLYRCGKCGHVFSLHEMNAGEDMYSGEYVSSTYSDADGVRQTFQKIINLPEDKSDNAGRVKRIVEYAAGRFAGMGADFKPTILDVGSGLCVFPYKMKESGWDCTALDPDPRAAEHAENVAGVKALCGDFMKTDIPGSYDAVSFNKVLEHVEDPVTMLARAAGLIEPGGFVYVELPDAKGAWTEGPGREEFFIDHLHVFTEESTRVLADVAGFHIDEIETLREPSTKFTIRAFLTRD